MNIKVSLQAETVANTKNNAIVAPVQVYSISGLIVVCKAHIVTYIKIEPLRSHGFNVKAKASYTTKLEAIAVLGKIF